MPLYPHKTTITVNGTKVKIQEGRNSFQSIIAAAQTDGASVVASPKSIAVTPPAVQATTIGANDSYEINGGEVMTVS
jgi:hypothetical protein